MASQYSARVPLLLPMACEYSHMMSGRSRRPEVANSTMALMAGYIGQTRSVTARPSGPVEADGALVVQRPRGVVAAHPGGGRLVVGAVAGLVAQRPGDDGGMVAVAQDHARDARDPLRQVARVVAERGLEGVRLDVRLVDDVEAELIGQVEEGRVVGVVRGAHGVDSRGASWPAGPRRMASRVMTRPVCWSKSWRLTPWMTHASAIDEQVQCRGPPRCGSRP